MDNHNIMSNTNTSTQ